MSTFSLFIRPICRILYIIQSAFNEIQHYYLTVLLYISTYLFQQLHKYLEENLP